jgi:hypothetical protein
VKDGRGSEISFHFSFLIFNLYEAENAGRTVQGKSAQATENP